MSETPITDFIRLFNKAGSWIPATPKAELFVTANTWKLLNNVTKCFMIDFMGVLMAFNQTRAFQIGILLKH